MKRTDPTEATGEVNSGPTIFEQVAAIHSALVREMDLVPSGKTSEPQPAIPQWCLNILKQFRKTVLKPITKLRPNGEVNWRNYGRLIGIMERSRSFVDHDVPRILEEEFGEVTDEQWKKIEPMLGLDKARTHLIKVLGRPVADDEPLENLFDEAWQLHVNRLERQKAAAFSDVARQTPRIGSLFFKGMAEGYQSFIDELGSLCGDRGRTEIYTCLIAFMVDVERIRRTSPQKTRSRFYDDLCKVYRLPAGEYEWFSDVCDDIKFPIKSVGAPPKSASVM